VTDADTFFGAEAPAGMQWHWEQLDPSRLSQPLLAVVGADSDTISPVSTEGHEALLRRFPQAEPYVLPGATHLLQVQNAEDLGAALTDFFDRHPLNHVPEVAFQGGSCSSVPAGCQHGSSAVLTPRGTGGEVMPRIRSAGPAGCHGVAGAWKSRIASATSCGASCKAV